MKVREGVGLKEYIESRRRQRCSLLLINSLSYVLTRDGSGYAAGWDEWWDVVGEDPRSRRYQAV